MCRGAVREPGLFQQAEPVRADLLHGPVGVQLQAVALPALP